MFKYLAIIFFSVLQAQAGTVNLTLELSGLGSMQGQHYEGWNIVAGQAKSTGRFSINDNGNIYSVDSMGRELRRLGTNNTATFIVDSSQKSSTLFVLTIEPNGDDDTGPSSVHVMGGEYSSGAATLTTSHKSSLKVDFTSVTGSFIMAAPTGGEFNQGVWFVDPSEGIGSLSIPTLATGWAYEGWIVNTSNGKKISTGIFFDANGADSDAAGYLAGPLKLSFPSVPGQDIVESPVTLDDGKHAIVVSVEPYPDFDPAPYDIKIFKSDISPTDPGMTPLELNRINVVPTGLAHIRKTMEI